MADLSVTNIFKLLEEPAEDYFFRKRLIEEEASSDQFVLALEQATKPLTRQILSELAGRRFERDAVPTLLELLFDPSEGVRCEAADALGIIGDVRAGPVLLKLLSTRKRDSRMSPVPDMVASALGAVGYRPAIPLLIQTLEDGYPMIRGLAAWGLGVMCATEAESALRAALARKTEPRNSYEHARLLEAIEAISMAKRATTLMKREEAIPMLLDALKRKHSFSANTTCAAWALGKLRAKEGIRPLQRRLTKYQKGFMAELLRVSLNEIKYGAAPE